MKKVLLAGFTIAAMLLPSTAYAHTTGSSIELETVGRLNIAEGQGHITDIWALGNFAYLGSFDDPYCSRDITGVHIVDISDPAVPEKVGFIPAQPGTRVNDVKAASINTKYFKGDLLIHSNEGCTGPVKPKMRSNDNAIKSSSSDDQAKNGIAIYDVTNPQKPQALRLNFGNYQVHNTFIYQTEDPEKGNRAYALIVDDDNERDLHIVDITNPSSPKELAAVGAPDWPELKDNIGSGDVFLHDVWAQEKDGQMIAYLSYWDAGLVLLDITDPANPLFLGDSEYLNPDPVSGQKPEGNSHVAVPTEDGNLVFMGDEDFSPFASYFTIETGNFAGSYDAVEGSFTTPIVGLPDKALNGPTTFVGRACNGSVIPAPEHNTLDEGKQEEKIALIERGDCRFDEKISNVANSGYTGAIVFNSAADPGSLVLMSGESGKGTIPAVFVTRYTGFAILGISPDSPASTPLPEPGTTGEYVRNAVVFDGWGYARILDVSDPANIKEVGRFATEGVMDESVPPGDRTMHNVIVDGRRAYISWYADGLRVVDFSDPANPTEVAHFVDQGGSNFWGIYLYTDPDGNKYILGSDRDSGLWIFKQP